MQDNEQEAERKHYRANKSRSLSRWFILSVGVILLVTGAAKLFSALGTTKLLDYPDPLFGSLLGFKYRHLLFIAGVMELVLAYWCLRKSTNNVSLILIAGMSANFLLYRIGTYLLVGRSPCPCLGNLTDSLGITPRTADWVMKCVLIYLLVGSCVLISATWLARRRMLHKMRRGMAFIETRLHLSLILIGTVAGSFTTFTMAATPPDPFKLLLNPPRIERLIVRRTFKDGQRAYLLVRYDNGNFLVKMSKTQAGLENKMLVQGDDIAGRYGNKVWASSETDGNYIMLAYLDTVLSTNKDILDHQEETIFLANSISRLGCCVLTLGMEVPFTSHVAITNRSFSFESGDYDEQGTVIIEPPGNDGQLKFTNNFEKLKRRGDEPGVKIFYKVQGELSADNNLPIWFNLIESAPGKPDEYVGKAEVLQLKLAQSPLPESTFSIDENVLRGGYTALIYPTNNLLVVQSSNQHSVDKPIYFMGTLVNPSVVRIILIALMCIVTIAGAVIMLISHKRSNTRSTNQQQTK